MSTLDTSGTVHGVLDGAELEWSDLSPFTQGYIEALFAEPHPSADVRADGVGFSDLAPETLAQIIADCREMVARGLVNTPERGRDAWEVRQMGATIFPPLTIQLGDDGKVRFAAVAKAVSS